MADAQLPLKDDVKAALLRTDEDFRQLVSEHHALDEQIRHLSTLTYLTDQQQLRRNRPQEKETGAEGSHRGDHARHAGRSAAPLRAAIGA